MNVMACHNIQIFWIQFLLRICCLKALQINFPLSTPNIGHRDVIYTPTDILPWVTDLSQHEVKVIYHSHVILEVKACADAAVFLGNSDRIVSSAMVYDVYIGGGQDAWSSIRYWTNGYGVSNGNVYYGSVLSCTSYKPIWVHWNKQEIQFGTGYDVGISTKFVWLNPTFFEVKSIGLSTGYGNTGQWNVIFMVPESIESNGYFSTCGNDDNEMANMPILVSFTGSSLLCASSCDHMEDCFGFNYNLVGSKCQLLSVHATYLRQIPKTNSAIGWKFYSKSYGVSGDFYGCIY